MPELSAAEWEEFLSGFPDAHILQTSAWGELKAAFGWIPVRVAAASAGAQILFRRLPFGLTLAYIPKGPIGGKSLQGWQEKVETLPAEAEWSEFMSAVDAICRQHNAVFLKIEPDSWETAPKELGSGLPKPAPPDGFRLGRQAIQPRRTLLVDIGVDEERILGRMKQKTRYNIRLALKRGIVVHPIANLETFYRLVRITGGRDAFGVHSLDYYRRAYDLFHPQGCCEMLVAEFQGEPLAALMIFARGQRAWYFYGASSNEYRERMPTYLLQWEAIRWARAQGCSLYDLWGIPDADEETLENSFTRRSDGLWGVYRFKRGFGGRIARALGPYDRVYSPAGYLLYSLWAKNRAGEG
jgi:peptidoglycan pentaglycine glycine transferase (the first glycine)